MSSSDSSPYGFLYNPSLPSEETIVAQCVKLGLDIRGTTIVDPSTTSVIAWVKYGHDVDLDEARTQDWTAKALRDAGVSDVQAPRVFHAFTAKYYGTIGFIVMEYIEGVDCDSEDVDLVAKAVQALIGLQPPPTATLGHVGGGTKSIVHSFFPEWLPNANYRSDQDFYDHMYGIFKLLHIDFQGDLSIHGRFLCPSDIYPGNFRKRTMEDGRLILVALDFNATCFMPLPFIEVALKKNRSPFNQRVARKVTYTPSDDARALLRASGPLVQYGSKAVALPSGVSRKVHRR
ncbi:hypothetical protein FA95DRAFT_1562907 [Auriscalpium vulgare]|uniref:Uncharacterized protein n=1 Tax=Auriscalpium vulgare TaxID=40419 RepID=A0ACB8RHW3_9AGAM|nr:hypothetical protein FA95DRAFT_1562907 [Auriscalpium vulgare]